MIQFEFFVTKILIPNRSKIIKEDTTTTNRPKRRSKDPNNLIRTTIRTTTTKAAQITHTNHRARLTTSQITITTTTTTLLGERGRPGQIVPNHVEQDGLRENESALIISRAKSTNNLFLHFYDFFEGAAPVKMKKSRSVMFMLVLIIDQNGESGTIGVLARQLAIKKKLNN